MYRNDTNLRLQADLHQLGMYQRDMLALLRLKTVSDDMRKSAMEDAMNMHQELTRSLQRSFKEWQDA